MYNSLQTTSKSTNKLGRYRRHRPRTTLAISPQLHEAIKAYAASRNLRLEDTTEYLIMKALESEYANK